MLRILPSRFAVGLAVSVLAVQQASAQSQSLFGNRGPIGQRNAQNSGGATGGGAAAGSGMFSRGTQGGAGGGTRPGAAQAPAVGNVTGFSGGFVGTGDNLGRFIGSQQAGQQGIQGGGQNRLNIGNRNRAGGGANDRLNQNGGFGQNQFGNQAGNRPRTTVRAAQRVAFEYPQPVPAEVRTSLQTQFRQLSDRRPQLAGISIALDGGDQAVLRGEVATEDARKLAEAVARLEPGVRTVKNEITVRTR
jgi:hypothetical protein